ncbi:indoleamine 2,3-dioxygenase [Parasphingopyxis algicola]|uniref:indoleamine 2,3-dioxygenase n=1 Tax=Parasphingopyxis algicola TaxID=2026624 RepID=UPI0015A225D6|nr:indoleamine 2,3-dioxygenase [Parasphingopyxis algicola]QLC23739.1 indoleamine 2,3-dioxygenase [Parasphingopyxis algicola]
MELSTYGMSRERGYLSDFEIDEISLPPEFDTIVEAANTLSAILTTGRARHWLEQLPQPDMTAFLAEASDAQIRVAMVRYSFLVQAYVWGEDSAPTVLPAMLAVPIDALAEKLGQAPLLPYSGYVLDNWYRLDKSAPIALDNIAMRQNFLGGMDENWFVLIHVAIEAEAGRALELATEIVAAADDGDAGRVETLLQTMNTVWDRINAHFDRMPERCEPHIYYQRVRPYIHGWKNNPATPEGIIYEGVERYGGKPQAFRGQTGSQSSIVPAMDALFNVTHENDALREFLAELHPYRPIPHRRFIEDLAEASRLRAFAKQQSSGVKDAFNACVEQVARFRTRHLEYAASYINKQVASGAGNDVDVGTGGTPFMKYLKKHRDENRAQLV